MLNEESADPGKEEVASKRGDTLELWPVED
jgi:hypothetical protein